MTITVTDETGQEPRRLLAPPHRSLPRLAHAVALGQVVWTIRVEQGER
jgi:hypothetical protein